VGVEEVEEVEEVEDEVVEYYIQLHELLVLEQYQHERCLHEQYLHEQLIDEQTIQVILTGFMYPTIFLSLG